MKMKRTWNGVLISGLPGAGKSTLAKELARVLGWQRHSIGDLIREQWRKNYPNGGTPFEEYARHMSMKDNREADKKAKIFLKQGKTICDLRHGIIGEDLPVLRVFLTAPLEIRATRALKTKKYQGKTLSQMRRILSFREKNEVRMASRLYGRSYDFRSPNGYHLTLHAELLELKEKISLILNLVGKNKK